MTKKQDQINDGFIKLVTLWYGEQEAANRCQRKANETWKTLSKFAEKNSMSKGQIVLCWQKARPDVQLDTAERYAWMVLRTLREPRIKKAVFEEGISVRAAIKKFAVPQKPREPMWMRLLSKVINIAYEMGIPLVEIAKKTEELYAKLAA